MRKANPAVMLTTLCVAALCGCTSRGSEDPEKILRKMIRASSQTNFTGVTSFERQLGNQYFRFRMKITHRAPDLTRLEFLEPESKKGQVIIKRGGHSWKLGAGNEEPVNFKQLGSHRNTEIRNLDLLLQNYQMNRIGSEEIAHRLADIIQILSRHQAGIQRMLWIDHASSMLLKSEETVGEGAVKYSRVFTYEQIDFPKHVPDYFFQVPMPHGSRSALPAVQRDSISLAEARRIAPFPIKLPGNLPKGFILEQICWIERPPSGFLHFQYSDGLISVSLFEEGSEGFHPPVMARLENQAADADKIYRMNEGGMTILHRRHDGTHATLVGEIAAEDLIKMISSLESADETVR